MYNGKVGQRLEDIAEEEEPVEEEEDLDIGDEDEMADFIVDEEEVDENGAPLKYLSFIVACFFYSSEMLVDSTSCSEGGRS